ncbi:ferric reductase-like transmembrane domain-containing protein [Phaeovulum sp. NW3]|uniref:ferredoxin reductase family protein n=1 Tax=Phaeovulum sp. NW3 TaxID=2934933 RepID=UPI0020216991|nr:ferric reductase-like transmembrane domain-containing protein [Phaeovulum sp. NW3]MCL7466815.1 ferric reductase-like transmembrane domain-containing protein [Phaeovulum sp. NW3]
MLRIKLVFWIGLLGLTVLWLAAAPGVFAAQGLFALRTFMLQYSGLLAFAMMSVAMILSLRPRWPERRLDGLDKVYRLHKWLGIGGLVLSITHWLWVEGPKWAVGWGLAERPQRGPRAPIEDPVAAFLSGYRSAAEGVGEWAFYAAVALIVVALVRLVPYGVFRRLHRLLAPIYLALAFHTIILTDFSYWTQPVGIVLAGLLLAGSYAAVISILGRIGAGRRIAGQITELTRFPGVHSLEKLITLGPGWPGHQPGQFAFVTSDPREGAHPYTIASAWDPTDRRIKFVTKALGDYTSQLGARLEIGQPVTVEGPYGCFTFADDCPVQIWIGGGIGITPFLGAMQARARQGGVADKAIHLFHTTAEVDETALARIRADAQAADVHLHLMIDARDGRLTGDRIRAAVPDWRTASLWFCGPEGFGHAIRKDMAAHGMPVTRFHQELFQMR